ncbi:MAG: hypothetical protein OXJ53_08790 [Gammaproteobacteria bacterium]|nr:hypothetical protein [Gammaproteobacteria bacterium]MDD9962152.1 hypothetical protein [Gammaproteobacteria bacterium]MDE0273609.1 hypothetical protein [Gammaproteobacteria bacterium]
MIATGPDARIPLPLAGGLGLQLAGLVLPGIVLIPVIVYRGAHQSEGVLLWAVFASVVVCGAATALQSLRLGRFGAGYLIPTGTSGPSIAVAIAALEAGGPSLLAALVVALALFQFAFSARLALFRRVLTPAVTGSVIMLVPVTVMPVIFDQLGSVPEGGSAAGGPLSALATLAAVVGITLKARGALRLWAPVVGIVAGTLVASAFGLYGIDRVADAPWVGLPDAEWPGVDFRFGDAFWALLPAFLFIAAVCTIQTVSGAVAIQRVSWPGPRAVDFRAVQGAVAADSAGNLLSAVAGTMPVGFRPAGASMVEITGVASRSIGIALGMALIVLACLPKALAVVLAIPGPVVATFITVMMATVFMIGVKVVAQGGIDYRKGMIVGIAFWTGVGFENGVVFPEFIAGLTGGLPPNGMIAGGVVAIVATLLAELTRARRSRLEVAFDRFALGELRDFVTGFAKRCGWDGAMAARLDAVSEETLLTLLAAVGTDPDAGPRRLLVAARREDGGATLEFVAAPADGNLQDRIAVLGEAGTDDALEREVSLRLLRHLASSVRHQQYYDTDVVMVRVESPMPGSSPGSQ